MTRLGYMEVGIEDWVTGDSIGLGTWFVPSWISVVNALRDTEGEISSLILGGEAVESFSNYTHFKINMLLYVHVPPFFFLTYLFRQHLLIFF